MLLWVGEFDGVPPSELVTGDLPNQHNIGARSLAPQPTVSQRLTRLIGLGLVEGRREREGVNINTILYALTDAGREVLDDVSSRSPKS